jgi:hypothetical protein
VESLSFYLEINGDSSALLFYFTGGEFELKAAFFAMTLSSESVVVDPSAYILL